LPDKEGRLQLLERLLKDTPHQLTSVDLEQLVVHTDGYSGADLQSICTEAAMGPVREIYLMGGLDGIQIGDMPSITKAHFDIALETVAPSVSQSDLSKYIEWNSVFGTYRKLE